MGLTDKLVDSALHKVFKKETIRLPYEEVTNLIEQYFIAGADDALLENIRKTAKGGIILAKNLSSKDGRYSLHVEPCALLSSSKIVWIFDNDNNMFYQLDKNRKWKKFYQLVDVKIKMERINRIKGGN